MFNNENYTTPLPEIYQEQIALENEKKQLKKRCNFIGLIILVSTIVFLGFSLILSVVYGIMQIYSTPDIIDNNADSLALNLLSGLCNITAIGICGAIFIKYLNTETHEVIPFKKISFKKLVALCIIGFAVCSLSNYLTSLFLSSAYSFGIDLDIDSYNYDSNSVLEIIVYIVSAAVVPAFSEELLFRGAVLGSLRKYGDGLAIFVSSLFFGIFHGNFVQFPFAFIVGLVLSFTVVYTNSMLPAILIHFSNNCFSVISDILYTNTECWGLNETIIDIATYAVIIIVSVLAVYALIKLARNDKGFLKLTPYEGSLESKMIKNAFLTNPLIIIAFLLLLGESILTHMSI